MVKLTSTVLSVVALLALAVTLFAQGNGKGGILQPQMTVEKGTYKAPFGKMGEKPAAAWSATTLGASVDGKPNAGAVRTVTGEIIDFSCYLEVGKHGEKHRDCAQKCFRAGQPIGLLTQAGDLYMLMEEEHDPHRTRGPHYGNGSLKTLEDVVEF
jgi:hypothetical protein